MFRSRIRVRYTHTRAAAAAGEGEGGSRRTSGENRPGTRVLRAEPVSRRSVLKGIGAGALALGAGGFLEACSNSIKGSGRRQRRQDHDRVRQPADRRARRLRVRRQLHRRHGSARPTRTRTASRSGGKTYTVEISGQGQPVRPEPGLRRSRSELDHTRTTPTSSSPARRRRRPTRSATVCETREASLRLDRRARGRRGTSRVRPTRRTRSRSSTRRCTSSAPRRSAAASSRCGTASRPTRSSAGSSPTTPTATRSATAWPGMVKAAGYTFVDGGAYPDGTTDFTPMISKFKRTTARSSSTRRCRPTSTRSGSRRAQQGFKPKLATVAKVLLFPADTEALGDLVNNIATDSWWGPYMPYKSSLDGETTQQLADAYQDGVGQAVAADARLHVLAVRGRAAGDDRGRRPARQATRSRRSCSRSTTQGMSGPLDFTDRAAHRPGRPEQPDDPRHRHREPGRRAVEARAPTSRGRWWSSTTASTRTCRSAATWCQPTHKLFVAALLELDRDLQAVRAGHRRRGAVARGRAAARPSASSDPNGAGKTSLFGVISGDLSPDAGEIRFDGRSMTAARSRRALPAGHRPHLPGAAPVRGHDRVRERAGGGAAGRRACAGRPATTRRGRALERRGPAGRMRTGWPASSGCSSASGSSWPGRSPRGPGCSCSTRWPAG